MQIKCSSKKIQYLLSILIEILLLFYIFRLEGGLLSFYRSFGFFGFMQISGVIFFIFLIPFFWNNWMHSELKEAFKKRKEKFISYGVFQCFLTIVFGLLCCFLLVLQLINYVPNNYLPGSGKHDRKTSMFFYNIYF